MLANPTPEDFYLPLNAQNSGPDILGDWYRVHHRIAKSLGARFDGERSRYVFCDEPTLEEPGRAIRIRAICPQVISTLIEMGIPYIGPSQIPEGEADFVMSVSLRGVKGCPVRSERDQILRLIGNAGISGVDLDEASWDTAAYFIQKGRGHRFSLPGARVRFRGVVSDPELFATAIREGIGRDKGVGFGLLAALGV